MFAGTFIASLVDLLRNRNLYYRSQRFGVYYAAPTIGSDKSYPYVAAATGRSASCDRAISD